MRHPACSPSGRARRRRCPLTAYVVDFMTRAAEAGYAADAQSLDRAKNGLSQSLRSDSLLWDVRWANFERVQAFAALEASGRWEASYAGYFLERADKLDLYSKARLYQTLKKRNALGGKQGTELERSLFGSLVVKKERGKEVLAGVRDFAGSGRVLLTETRTIAAVLEALAAANQKDKRIELLADWAGGEGRAATAGARPWIRSPPPELSARGSSPPGARTSSWSFRTGALRRRCRPRVRPSRSSPSTVSRAARSRASKGAEKEGLTVLVSSSYVPRSKGCRAGLRERRLPCRTGVFAGR